MSLHQQEDEGLSFQAKSVDEKKADYDHANKEVGDGTRLKYVYLTWFPPLD